MGTPEQPAASVTVSKPPNQGFLVTTSGAGTKSPKSGHLGKRIAKWSKNENKILWECYIRSITTLRTDYVKRMHQHGLACKQCNYQCGKKILCQKIISCWLVLLTQQLKYQELKQDQEVGKVEKNRIGKDGQKSGKKPY